MALDHMEIDDGNHKIYRHTESERCPSYPTEHPQEQQRSQKPVPMGQIISLSRKLIGHDAVNRFVGNCEKTLPEWLDLLSKTTPPNNMNSSDRRITSALNYIDTIITGKQGTYLLRRLAYAQLTRLLDALEGIIKTDIENGLTDRERGCRNSSIALGIYMAAQGQRANVKEVRRRLIERRRLARRWAKLGGQSPLRLLIYSDAAESIV